MVVTHVTPGELERIKHCQGCGFLGRVHVNGYCKYFLETGKRRPNPMGDKNCAVRIIVDSEADIRLAQNIKGPKKPGVKKSETGPHWDVALAKEMYDNGALFKDIAEAVGISVSYAVNYANSHNWGRRKNGKAYADW